MLYRPGSNSGIDAILFKLKSHPEVAFSLSAVAGVGWITAAVLDFRSRIARCG